MFDLTAGRRGAPPLWLGGDGAFRDVAPADRLEPDAPHGQAATTALIRAARWISTRRSLTFERLFPVSPFRPGEPVRSGGVTPAMAQGLLAQVRSALDVAGPEDVQLRSACVTVLSHLVASVGRAPELRPAADTALAWLFEVIEREVGDDARPALRAHTIQLLQLRAPHLPSEARARVSALLAGLVRAAPPYAELIDAGGPLRFAMCSAWDFHAGEVEVLRAKYGFVEVTDPEPVEGLPPRRYVVLEAPFRGPHGRHLQVWARSATPADENEEMGVAGFVGLLVNRHAQLGAFDMRASLTRVTQRGYKLMMNGQCAGLTTRFAISRLFPDADIYSSWDSTYFRTDAAGAVSASETIDCFVELLRGFAAEDTHVRIAERMRKVQWYHKQQAVAGFVQFIGPSHPLVVARYSDVNHDGKADLYDGFLDFELHTIAEDLRAGASPRDPGVAASQIGGDAARGLDWAVGSLNRVTQYSELWASLPGSSEIMYAFTAAGFYTHLEPPADLPTRPLLGDPGLQPSISRYGAASVEVMLHGWLAHTPMELKRLFVAAEAIWAGFDAGQLRADGALSTLAGRRAMVLLTLAGLLEFPADQNYIDALWASALRALRLPEVSRSVVRACITDADHDAGNYYGSTRGIRQLLGESAPGALAASDPVAAAALADEDPSVGRAQPLVVA